MDTQGHSSSDITPPCSCLFTYQREVSKCQYSLTPTYVLAHAVKERKHQRFCMFSGPFPPLRPVCCEAWSWGRCDMADSTVQPGRRISFTGQQGKL